MPLVTTTSNLDYLITPLQMHYGDYEGTAYSEAVYRTALLNAIRYLYPRWNGKYLFENNNLARNPNVQFENTETGVEHEGDEYALVLAATIILRTINLTSSADSFERWETPDLKFWSVGKERVLTKQYEDSVKALDDHFAKKLGSSRKRFLYTVNRTYPVYPIVDDVPGSDT